MSVDCLRGGWPKAERCAGPAHRREEKVGDNEFKLILYVISGVLVASL